MLQLAESVPLCYGRTTVHPETDLICKSAICLKTSVLEKAQVYHTQSDHLKQTKLPLVVCLKVSFNLKRIKFNSRTKKEVFESNKSYKV